jgi:3-keto-5-aminohexanoate cleavage enzyme
MRIRPTWWSGWPREMLAHDVKPEIEAFDLSHIFKAREMADKGQLAGTPYIQFVMGVKNAMPADRDVFDYYVHTVRRLFGDEAPWCAAGIGASQIVLNDWAIAAGGHARTGLEDNVRIDRETLAPSNGSAGSPNRRALCQLREAGRVARGGPPHPRSLGR